MSLTQFTTSDLDITHIDLWIIDLSQTRKGIGTTTAETLPHPLCAHDYRRVGAPHLQKGRFCAWKYPSNILVCVDLNMKKLRQPLMICSSVTSAIKLIAGLAFRTPTDIQEDREEVDKNVNWACPACADLTAQQKQKEVTCPMTKS